MTIISNVRRPFIFLLLGRQLRPRNFRSRNNTRAGALLFHPTVKPAHRQRDQKSSVSNRALLASCSSWTPVSFSHSAKIASTSRNYFSSHATSSKLFPHPPTRKFPCQFFFHSHKSPDAASHRSRKNSFTMERADLPEWSLPARRQGNGFLRERCEAASGDLCGMERRATK